MNDHTHPTGEAAEVIVSAHGAADAMQQLCRATMARPSMRPTEVDVVLAHLAEAVAALPQIASQLGDMLEQSKDGHVLAMDTLTETEDPDLAIDTGCRPVAVTKQHT